MRIGEWKNLEELFIVAQVCRKDCIINLDSEILYVMFNYIYIYIGFKFIINVPNQRIYILWDLLSEYFQPVQPQE